MNSKRVLIILNTIILALLFISFLTSAHSVFVNIANQHQDLTPLLGMFVSMIIALFNASVLYDLIKGTK